MSLFGSKASAPAPSKGGGSSKWGPRLVGAAVLTVLMVVSGNWSLPAVDLPDVDLPEVTVSTIVAGDR